ncbi:uncharacterized protein LOC124703328 [Lolium rigidum]|uniref:uncharacterized protein LOC124703328 n=1 Tax=Lolium rigidum TaxID=89674 RepID=UPI001F5E2FBB|nr:uncharacterized protein LOC124703328 [Lolium rigidum]
MKSNRGRRRDMQIAADNGDRLSKLPNDLLLNILERVGTLDAVRTCILSRQMLKLPTMLSQIVIDLSLRDLVRMNGVVADVTDKILSARSPQITSHKLKVKFLLSPSRCLSIGKSVARAMATQKLNAAEFEILTPRDFQNCTEAYLLLFAAQLNNFLHACPDAFAGLTRLHLQNMRFAELDITNILITCNRLESLCFVECDAGICSVLNVEHARLVEFTIAFGEFKTVELSYLPKLQRMTYNYWPCDDNPLVLGFVPQLSELNLTNAGLSDKTLELSQLLANVHTVRDLYLNFHSEKIWVRPECSWVLAPVLAQLRTVNLDNLPEECDFAWTMFFLEAAQCLEELCFTVWDHKCCRESQKSFSKKTDVKWEPSSINFKHKNLRKLTIYGFQSDKNFTSYIRRTMKTAVNIQEISLHDRKVCKICAEKFPQMEARPSSYPRTDEEKDSLRKKIAAKPTMVASPAMIHFPS